MFLKRNTFKRLLYYIYGEKFFKRFNYNWSEYPLRYQIIQKIIDKKKYQNYLEIGCCDDSTFSKIKIKYKIGVDPNSGGQNKPHWDMHWHPSYIHKFRVFLIHVLKW